MRLKATVELFISTIPLKFSSCSLVVVKLLYHDRLSHYLKIIFIQVVKLLKDDFNSFGLNFRLTCIV